MFCCAVKVYLRVILLRIIADTRQSHRLPPPMLMPPRRYATHIILMLFSPPLR